MTHIARLLLVSIFLVCAVGCSHTKKSTVCNGSSGCTQSGNLRVENPIAQVVADTAITTSVKSALAERSLFTAATVGVETTDGQVVLSGSTSSGVEKNQAAAIARKVPGVRSVRNQIKIER